MNIGVVGRKAGMTRVFTDAGESIPVTVIEVTPNRIVQIKTDEVDGYSALQVTVDSRRSSRVTKAHAGHYLKAGSEAGRGLWELRADDSVDLSGLESGALLDVAQFEDGQVVDVSGVSKGKGFAGVVKRWNFQMQDATHGNSISHRAPGSIGQNQTPGRVFKGKKMAGHMGARKVTTQNLQVVRVDSGRNLLLIKGAVPGATGGTVVVRPAVKV